MRRSDPGEEGLGVGGFEVAKTEVQKMVKVLILGGGGVRYLVSSWR